MVQHHSSRTDADINYKNPEPWKVRWCGWCKCYEYDGGPPKGWVKLLGIVPRRDVKLNPLLDVAVARVVRRRGSANDYE